MFSALKKLARTGDERCPAPTPMSSSLQKKFSRGVHFNMKILIKGDRNVGKSCLLQRLQGGAFIEEYVPTDQIQVAPIHWTYKNTDYIVKVEVWEVVDKGRTKKKPPLGLKLENQATPAATEDGYDTPVLDATFLDVYKNASGVILMLDITKPWTFEYVVKELSRVPADLPVVILGNHCDMQHHRQVHPHHIEQAMQHAKMTRTAPIRYAESSMRNGFGLRLLHKFLSVPFLRLQKTSLLEQLQRNQKDMEEIEKDLDEYQNSEEAHYNLFVDRLANKRRQNNPETRPTSDRSPSIVLGAGKPIVPPNVNPLLAQSLNPKGIKAQHGTEAHELNQTQYVNPELLKPKHPVRLDMTPTKISQDSSAPNTPTGTTISASSGGLDEFYAGTLDSSFLEDLPALSHANQDGGFDSDSEDGDVTNPMVTFDEDDLDDTAPIDTKPNASFNTDRLTNTNTDRLNQEDNLRDRLISQEHDIRDRFKSQEDEKRDRFISQENDKRDFIPQVPTSKESKLPQDEDLRDRFISQVTISNESVETESSDMGSISLFSRSRHELSLDNEFPLWAGDSSARRSPEGGEDPDVSKEPSDKVKKHKKKKSKDKESGDKAERKDKKHKSKKSKTEKRNPQQDLLAPCTENFNYEDYDSI